jgi:hypothetical protein
MTTITAAAVIPVGSGYNTTPSYSGSFIPTIWSAKLNAKFYAASTFASICNKNWEGDIANLGDKVIIQNIPSLTISDYVVGGNLSYQTPVPSTIEMQVDRAKSFAFQVSDVLDYQSKPALMDMFSSDAAEQMRVVMDSTCIYRTFNGAATGNYGLTAGAKSGLISLGTPAAPIALTKVNVLATILSLASALDEQNVPDSGRYLLLDPLSRTLLLQSELGQAYLTGDATSPIRNGLIGRIDRFDVYVSNNLPYSPISTNFWYSGDGTETTTVATSSDAHRKRAIIAGQSTAIAFASQMAKTETLRNPTDFGDLVRGLNIFGHKVVKPEALAYAVVY